MRRITAIAILLIAALMSTSCSSMDGRRCRKHNGFVQCEDDDSPPLHREPREPIKRPHHNEAE